MAPPHSSPVDKAAAAHASIRLRATVAQLTRHLRALAAEGDGPGAAKLGVLGQLYRLGELTPTQLARHERVRLQTLTRLIAELESDRLVARTAHPDDARQSLLSLTTPGIRVLTADVHRREASLARAITSQLSAAECERLVEACALMDRLSAAMAPAPARKATTR